MGFPYESMLDPYLQWSMPCPPKPPSTMSPVPLPAFLRERHVYKPFLYPWCYEAWLTQQRIHWILEEVPLAEDVRDWKKKLTPSEKI